MLLLLMAGCGRNPAVIQESLSRGTEDSSATLTLEFQTSDEGPTTIKESEFQPETGEGIRSESETLPVVTELTEESRESSDSEESSLTTRASTGAHKKPTKHLPSEENGREDAASSEEGSPDVSTSAESTETVETQIEKESTVSTEAAIESESSETNADNSSSENKSEAPPTPEALPPVTPLPSPSLTGQRLEGVNYDAYLPVPEGVGRRETSASLAMNYGGYYTKNSSEKVIYLTYCMDYENGYTNQMLDVLSSLGIRACFFITGTYLSRRPDMARTILNRGHILGSHSYRHLYTYELSDVELINDFVLSKNLFRDSLGVSLQYYRPAYGSITERDMVLAQRFGLITVMFSFYYADYDLANQPSKGAALERLISGIRPGAIYYLHVTPCNIQALPEFVSYARSQGYTFLRLDQNDGGESPVPPTQPQPAAPSDTTDPETEASATQPPTTETPVIPETGTEEHVPPETEPGSDDSATETLIETEALQVDTETAMPDTEEVSESTAELPATSAPFTDLPADDVQATGDSAVDSTTAAFSETSPESTEPPPETEGESETKPPEESPAA